MVRLDRLGRQRGCLDLAVDDTRALPGPQAGRVHTIARPFSLSPSNAPARARSSRPWTSAAAPGRARRRAHRAAPRASPGRCARRTRSDLRRRRQWAPEDGAGGWGDITSRRFSVPLSLVSSGHSRPWTRSHRDFCPLRGAAGAGLPTEHCRAPASASASASHARGGTGAAFSRIHQAMKPRQKATSSSTGCSSPPWRSIRSNPMG